MTRNRPLAATCAALLAACAPLVAQAEQDREREFLFETDIDHDVLIEYREKDPFDVFLYPPETVLENADEIGLTDAQRDALIDRIVETQADVTRLELRAGGSAQNLPELLQAEEIDTGAVLEIVDRLLDVENETKRRYLALMIDVRNALSLEQRARVDAMRKENWRRWEH